LVRLPGTTTPRQAAARRTDRRGLVSGRDSLRAHTTAAGAAVAAAAQAARVQVQAWGEAVGPVEPAAGTVVVEADGAMVRSADGWQEVQVGVVGGVRAGEVTAASDVAARESAAACGPRRLAEAARRGALAVVHWQGPRTGPGRAVLRPVPVVGVGDGAPWIGNRAGDSCGERREVGAF